MIGENFAGNLMKSHGKYFRKNSERRLMKKESKNSSNIPHSKFYRWEKSFENFSPKFHIENFPKLNSVKQVNIERGMYN
jgi:hypothetical protein